MATPKRKKNQRKNKKKRQDAYLVSTPLSVILILAAVFSLSYLWICGRCEAMGKRIQALESDYEEVHKRRLNEEYKWSNLCSPARLEQALKQHNLEMAWPDRGQVIHLPLSMCSEEALQNGVELYAESREMRVVMND